MPRCGLPGAACPGNGARAAQIGAVVRCNEEIEAGCSCQLSVCFGMISKQASNSHSPIRYLVGELVSNRVSAALAWAKHWASRALGVAASPRRPRLSLLSSQAELQASLLLPREILRKMTSFPRQHCSISSSGPTPPVCCTFSATPARRSLLVAVLPVVFPQFLLAESTTPTPRPQQSGRDLNSTKQDRGSIGVTSATEWSWTIPPDHHGCCALSAESRPPITRPARRLDLFFFSSKP